MERELVAIRGVDVDSRSSGHDFFQRSVGLSQNLLLLVSA